VVRRDTCIQISIKARELSNEEIFVGNEVVVYARLQQAAGQVLGAVFEAQSINMAPGSFRSTGIMYKIPDLVMLSLPDVQTAMRSS
jgi:hypothetical protein